MGINPSDHEFQSKYCFAIMKPKRSESATRASFGRGLGMVILTAKPVDAELVAQVDGLAARRDGTVSGDCMFLVRGRCFASAWSLFSFEMSEMPW